MRLLFTITVLAILVSCQPRSTSDTEPVDVVVVQRDSTAPKPDNAQTENTPAAVYHYNAAAQTINTGNTTPQELVAFAKTLIDVPYKYASVDPHVGFDCSGFITFVFNHFNIAVPRSSRDFTNVHRQIPLQEAKAGDIILFTGTDSTDRTVGHMGIITGKENGEYQFIHSSSGKAHGVTITPLQDYYMSRFVKVIRVFKQNDKG